MGGRKITNYDPMGYKVMMKTSGPSLKLLSIVKTKGLDAIA